MSLNALGFVLFLVLLISSCSRASEFDAHSSAPLRSGCVHFSSSSLGRSCSCVCSCVCSCSCSCSCSCFLLVFSDVPVSSLLVLLLSVCAPSTFSSPPPSEVSGAACHPAGVSHAMHASMRSWPWYSMLRLDSNCAMTASWLYPASSSDWASAASVSHTWKTASCSASSSQ